MVKELMEISIKKIALQELLQRVQGAAQKNGTMPILRCVLLEVSSGQLSATATDLEIGITSSTNLDQVTSRGRVSVPVAMLLNIVKKLPGSQVELKEVNGFKLKVTAEEAEFIVEGEDPQEFPSLAIPEGDYDLATDLINYHQMIDACKHAISNDMMKYNLGGINFDFKEGKLTACATDGYRLSLAGKNLDGGGFDDQLEFSHLLSKKAIEEIKRLNDGPVQIYMYDNQVAFLQAGVTLVIRRVEGDFPDYRRVIPTTHPNCLTVESYGLDKSLDRVGLIAGKSALKLEASGNQLTISATTEAGHAIDRVPIEMEGADVVIGAKAHQLIDAIAKLGSELIIKYADDISVLLMLPVDYGFFDERLEIVIPVKL